MRESTKEASTTGIQPLCQQWYGQVRDIPWLQLGLTWVKGGTGSAEAQRRFKDAFDGSDLSTYDSHRRSQKKLAFGAEVSDKSLEAMELACMHSRATWTRVWCARGAFFEWCRND